MNRTSVPPRAGRAGDEEVLPGFGIVSWQAIFAPAGVPQPVVDNIQLE